MSSTAHEMDFLHHPCTGSVIPPLVSGWQNVLETNDMQEGDFCITPVYVLALSHPARLKIGGIAPLARKSEVSTESVHGVEHLGAYMVSIDLQPLSRHLSQLDLKVHTWIHPRGR